MGIFVGGGNYLTALNGTCSLSSSLESQKPGMEPIFDLILSKREFVLDQRQYDMLRIFLELQSFREKRTLYSIKRHIQQKDLPINNFNTVDEGYKHWKNLVYRTALARTLDDVNKDKEMNQSDKNLLNITLQISDVVVFEAKEGSFIISDVMPLVNKTEFMGGQLNYVSLYTISKTKAVALFTTHFIKMFNLATNIPSQKFRKPIILGTTAKSYKFRATTLYKKDVKKINEGFIKFSDEGYVY